MNSFFEIMGGLAQNVWIYGFSFLIVLSLLVFIHEWGHYIVARLCGVRVETFSIGFGKEIFGWTDKKGTRWKFSMIPLGGYVKMFGDSDPASAQHEETATGPDGKVHKMTAAERKVAFFAQPVWARALIVFAGPAINFLFAILVLSILYGTMGRPITPSVVTAVEIGGAADIAGFQPHDKVLKINGKSVTQFSEIQRAVMIALDEEMTFQVERDGEVLTLTPTPKRKEMEDRFGFRHDQGLIGILGPGNGLALNSIVSLNGQTLPEDEAARRAAFEKVLDRNSTMTLKSGGDDTVFRVAPVASRNMEMGQEGAPLYNALVLGDVPPQQLTHLGPLQAVTQAVSRTYEITTDSLKALWQIVTGTRSATELGGIIRIGAIAGDMAQQGFIALVTFTALLSINLGLINLFPIPLLDGGHLMFYAIEAAKGSPVSDRMQEYAFRFGLIFLVALMGFSNLNDIFQLIL